VYKDTLEVAVDVLAEGSLVVGRTEEDEQEQVTRINWRSQSVWTC